MKQRIRTAIRRGLTLVLCINMVFLCAAAVVSAEEEPGNAGGVPECTAETNDMSQSAAGPSMQGADTGAVGNTKIMSMTLQDFTPYGGSGKDNIDLLKQTEPLKWDALLEYTLSFTVQLDTNVKDKSLRVTLPYGMQFLGLVEEEDGVSIPSESVETVEWQHSEPVYGVTNNSDFQRNNGTLIIHFKDEGWSTSTFSLIIQPDIAFLPAEEKDTGFLIEEAVKAEIQVGEEISDPVTVAAKVFTANNSLIGGNWNREANVSAGDTYSTTIPIYWNYIMPSGGGTTKHFIDEAAITFAVPANWDITAAISGVQAVKSAEQGDYTIYTLTRKGCYGATFYFCGNTGRCKDR